MKKQFLIAGMLIPAFALQPVVNAVQDEDYADAASHVLGAATLEASAVSPLDLSGDGFLRADDLALIKRMLISKTPSGDGEVAAVQFTESGVKLTDASGAEIDAGKAMNLSVTNNTYIEITKPCELAVTGECSNAKITVNVDKTTYPDGEVTISLGGAKLSNQSDSPVYIAAIGGECAISAKNGTENTISDGTSYTNADGGCGSIYACDDIKLKGKGILNVIGNADDAIVCKNDIKIWNGTINVTAADDGIRGKDSVRIGDKDDTDYSALKLTVKANGDGIKSTNTEDADCGFVRICGGTISVNAQADGIQSDRSIELLGGDIDIYTLSGSAYVGTGQTGGQTDIWGGMDNSNKNKVPSSAKGIKCCGILAEDGTTYVSDGNITISGGNITVNSSDDSIHSAGKLEISGGTLTLESADDALHSDNELNIMGGTIRITKCYEGIEAMKVQIDDGDIEVTASDDAINSAGGSDDSGGGGMWGGFGQTNSNNTIVINGGKLYLTAKIDGIDSNGSMTVNGGRVVVSAVSSEGGAGPLDADGNTYLNGGEVNAIGGTGWVETPKSDSKQNIVRITLASQNTGIIAICAADGTAVAVYESASPYQSFIHSSEALVSGQTYTIYTGGSYAGGDDFHGVRSGGTYTAGTVVSSFTVSGAVTSVGSSSFGGWGW